MNFREKIVQAIKERRDYYREIINKEEPYIKRKDTDYSEGLDEEQLNDYVPNETYFDAKSRQSEANVILRDIVEKNIPENMDDVSDGYHTFQELYDYRLLYNAAFFNELDDYKYNWDDGGWISIYDVHKSKRHSDGEECFGGGWFIVMAELPTGQISNHYEMKYWDYFNIPEKEKANKWDGHTPQEAAERLKKFILKQYEA